MTKLAILWRLLELLLLLVDRVRTARYREEGRSEALSEIEVRNAEQAEAAADVARANAGTELGALEQRMRPYERVTT